MCVYFTNLIIACFWVLFKSNDFGTSTALLIGVPLLLFTSIILMIESENKKREADKTKKKGGEYLDII
jgi:hypothetical protein